MDQTRKLAGVCGGLANYLKMDAIIIRVGFVVLTVLSGAGIPIYLAMWLLVPNKPRASQQDVLSDKAASSYGSAFGSAGQRGRTEG